MNALLSLPPFDALPPVAAARSVRAGLVGGAVGAGLGLAGIGLAGIGLASQLPPALIDTAMADLPSGWVLLPAAMNAI